MIIDNRSGRNPLRVSQRFSPRMVWRTAFAYGTPAMGRWPPDLPTAPGKWPSKLDNRHRQHRVWPAKHFFISISI